MTAPRILRSKIWAGVVISLLLVAIIRVPFRGTAPSIVPVANISELPSLVFFSWLRMLAAYLISLVVAVFIGTLAATNERRARLLLPLVDILQSTPILSFFPVAIYWFVKLGGTLIGVEAAVIFLIFTCQSWNLVFAVFDGIKSVPAESLEAARSMGLGELAIFRRLYLPTCFPRIIDNSVVSWANGWYFLMACEIMALGSLSYHVRGIGSFLQTVISNSQWSLVLAGLGALILVILLMDVFVWKPLRSLSAIFKFESSKEQASTLTTGDRLLSLYRHSVVFLPLRKSLDFVHHVWVRTESFLQPPSENGFKETRGWKWGSSSSLALFWVFLTVAIGLALTTLGRAILPPWTMAPQRVLLSIGVSALRILVAYVLSLLWILPIVYWAHTRPLVLRIFQSSAQILSSVPATAFFPLITLAVLKLTGSIELAVQLLLMTGMQWYLLFNILGGANSLPNDIREVANSLGVGRSLYIKRVFLPSIVPALVTGSITAIGGGWNALVISESSQAASHPYSVFGIGSIINDATYVKGDERLMSLALLFLVTVIVLLNRFMWQPIYKWAERKFRLEG